MEAEKIPMRSKLGYLYMLLGALLVSGALTLFLTNRQADKTAEDFGRSLLPVLREEIEAAPLVETVPDNTPRELLNQEDLIMTETVINGHSYIGYLTIEDLNLELPVMSGWTEEQLRISPCRYSGTVRGEDLVIMAHNYKSHFGYLAQLKEGAQVRFADMDGTVWNYEVAATDVLKAEEVEAMTAGEYDLTLFTCSSDRVHRITVRCNRV